MSEYIEREAAIREMLFRYWEGKETLREIMQSIPAADVVPVVRGKWRLGGYGQISNATEKWYDKYLQGGFLYCSVCKGRTSVKYNFCPNCGADMRPTSMSGANWEES